VLVWTDFYLEAVSEFVSWDIIVSTRRLDIWIIFSVVQKRLSCIPEKSSPKNNERVCWKIENGKGLTTAAQVGRVAWAA
jgi:hypothetical protein